MPRVNVPEFCIKLNKHNAENSHCFMQCAEYNRQHIGWVPCQKMTTHVCVFACGANVTGELLRWLCGGWVYRLTGPLMVAVTLR